MKCACVLAYPLVALLVAAAAPSPAPSTQAGEPKRADSGEVICEKLQVTGSRLVAKRVCKTRAQWAEERLQDRQDLEKLQVQQPLKQ